MAIYMHIPNINGNVTASGFQNWIEVGSINFSAGRHVKTIVGRPNDREHSHPNFSAITVVKTMDKASPHLLQTLSEGKAIDQVEIQLCKTVQNSLTPFLKYTLSNVIISHRSVSSNGGSMPVESLSLNFTKIEESFTPFDQSNQQQAPIHTGYDLETAVVM